jgi:hypothetical protein
MKIIGPTVKVPEERVIMVELPEDINAGERHVVMVITRVARRQRAPFARRHRSLKRTFP